MGDGAVGGMGPLIRPAGPADLPAVHALLESRELPGAGVDAWIERYVVAQTPGGIAGVAGLEVYADGALLRSVAVRADVAGTGVGRQLVDAALTAAAEAGVSAVWLLTTTAEGWFPRFGFRVADRSSAPPGVAGSIEFREACPASAVAMVLDGDALSSRAGPSGERL